MTRTDTPPEPLESLRDHHVALETTDPDAEHAPLRAFHDALADVDVVGLGEATHRTREFVHLKHRLVASLADVHGLRALALEAPFSETVALDEYVRDGTGDLRAVVADLGLSIYETEEAVAFFEALRSYNDGLPRTDRIRVYGFDVQSAAGAASALHDWLSDREAYPQPAEFLDDHLLDTLDRLADGVFEGEDVDADHLRAAERVADALAEWFGATFDEHTGDDVALARRHRRTLQQACAFARTGIDADRTEQWGLRDAYMAENVAWIREHAPGDRVAVWAHNNHVKTGRLGGDGHPSRTMGDRLAERFGDGYYALGAQFAHGTVRAYAPTDDGGVAWDGETYAKIDVSVPRPDDGSVPALFSRVDARAILVDYRSLPADSSLRSWLADERPHRFVAGLVHPDEDDAFARSHRSLDVFDGLFFVEEATPTTPL